MVDMQSAKRFGIKLRQTPDSAEETVSGSIAKQVSWQSMSAGRPSIHGFGIAPGASLDRRTRKMRTVGSRCRRRHCQSKRASDPAADFSRPLDAGSLRERAAVPDSARVADTIGCDPRVTRVRRRDCPVQKLTVLGNGSPLSRIESTPLWELAQRQFAIVRDAGGSRTHLRLLCRQPPDRPAPASVNWFQNCIQRAVVAVPVQRQSLTQIPSRTPPAFAATRWLAWFSTAARISIRCSPCSRKAHSHSWIVAAVADSLPGGRRANQ